MTHKHTPGPWIVSADNWSQTTGDTYSIANEKDCEREANARLIAAAPELLAALEAMVLAFDFHDEKKMLHAKAILAVPAISKATGAAQ